MSPDRKTWRLILDPPQDGFENMARDEALLEACRRDGENSGAYPVLRVYGWNVPTLSLGRFQDALRSVDQGFCREHGIPVVRRPTGGAAVLHDREVTYCLVGPTGKAPFCGSILDSYREIAAGIVEGLSLLGLVPDLGCKTQASVASTAPSQCFARAGSYEVTFTGKKVVGSAQVRRKGAALQHGSILLDANGRLFDEATGGQREERRGWTTLRELLGRRPDFEEVALALARGLGSGFSVNWELGEIAAQEDRLAQRLRARKYLNAHWTARGSSTLSRI
jgi:lipoyl(octanoyl) transferase